MASTFRKATLGLGLALLVNAPSRAQVVQTFAYTGAMQGFTVPACVSTMTIEVNGAQGGGGGGFGARMTGVFAVSSGQVLNILVGGMGAVSANLTSNGGGGGSFVVLSNGTPLCIAGGGGGTAHNTSNGNYAFIGGQTGTAGQVGQYAGAGNGGINGNGGFESYTTASPSVPNGGGGGGLLTNGGSSGAATGGAAFVNGGAGGAILGGFGGGGGANTSVYGCGLSPHGGCGGGGYSGGGAGGSNCNGAGGGGGSFNSGSNQVNVASFNSGNGQVVLRYVFAGTLASAMASPTVICAGGTTTLNSGGGQVSYTWSPGGSNSSSITVSPVVNTVYTVQAINALGCLSSATIAVPVNTAVPTLTVVNGANMVCAGKTSTLTASGATTYTWVGGVNPPNGISFVPASTADYTVTGENACGTSTAVASITVNPLPNITASAGSPTVCTGSTSILNGTGSASGYTWTNGVTNNVAFSPAATNAYTVTGASALGCTNTAVVTITVFITPTVVPVASPTAICVGKTATLSSIGATSGYTWSTTPPVYTSSVAVSPLVSTIYTVTRASGACVSTSTINLVVNPLPNLQVSTPNPSVVCANSAASLAAAGAITYTWFPGSFQGSNITVYPNYSSSPINYTVVASNANCTISAISTISTNPNPTISVAASSSVICAGSTATMTANGAVSYTWQSPVPAGQQNQAVVTVNPLIPTLYNLSGTNSFGCVSGGNQVILVNAAPNLTTNIVNPGGYICANGMATLTAIGTGPTNFNWLNTGATVGTIMVNPPTSTIYTVVGTNPTTGCQSVGTLSLAVYISTFVVSSPTAVCKGSTVTLSANGAASSYTWIVGIPIANNTPSVSVSPQLTTLYNVIGSTGSCNTTQTVNLIVHQVPNVTASAVKPTICRFEPGALLASGATSYSWTGGPGTAGYTVFPTVTSTYVVTGTDNNNCSKSVIVTQLVAACIGLEEQSMGQLLNIYPNPNQGEFTVASETPLNISIVNELGQVVRTFGLSEKSNKVNVSNLANGIYFILAEKDGHITSRKMIVEK